MYTHIRKQMQSKYGNPIYRLDKGGIFPNAEPGSLASKVQLGIASPEEIEQYKRQIELESENMEDATNWSNDIQTTAESITNNQQVAQDVYEARKNDEMNELKSIADDIVKQKEKELQKEQNYASFAQAMGVNSKYIGDGKGQMSAKGAAITGGISQGVAMAANAIDNLAMGDKNFGAQSQAIDGAVHMASGALMKSGNPYCQIAGAALEGANFLTKAGGQTVQGYDVDIDNSGYGNLGHMESSSSRDLLTLVGLGGLKTKSVQAKLARRNEQVRTALAAAQISEDQKFESEARMNSVENTIMNNQIALAGGLQTNLLGS